MVLGEVSFLLGRDDRESLDLAEARMADPTRDFLHVLANRVRFVGSPVTVFAPEAGHSKALLEGIGHFLDGTR